MMIVPSVLFISWTDNKHLYCYLLPIQVLRLRRGKLDPRQGVMELSPAAVGAGDRVMEKDSPAMVFIFAACKLV